MLTKNPATTPRTAATMALPESESEAEIEAWAKECRQYLTSLADPKERAIEYAVVMLRLATVQDSVLDDFLRAHESFDATGLLNQVFEKYLNAERGLFQLSQQFVAHYGAVPKEVVNKLSQARLELFGKVVQCFEARVKSERRTLNILQARMAANGEPLPEQMLSAMRRICGDRRRGHPGTWRRDRMIAMVIRDVVAEFSCSDRRAASVVSAALERLKWPVTEPAVRQIWRNFRRPRVPARRPRG